MNTWNISFFSNIKSDRNNNKKMIRKREQDFLAMGGAVAAICPVKLRRIKGKSQDEAEQFLACGAAPRRDSFIKPSTSCLKCSKRP